MPELPEVERERKKAERSLVGKRVVKAIAANDRIVLAGVTPSVFARTMKGRRIVAIRRKGKYLWFQLDKRPWPIMHFGMGGHFEIYKAAKERPRYWKLELVMTDGTRLAMTNPRRLGRIRLVNHPESEPPISLLGFDPYLDLPPLKTFAALVSRRRAPIKAVLLDQSFAAGVGNWIADEVLYQAGILPTRIAAELAPAEIRALRSKLSSVIHIAVKVNAEKDAFPRHWLFHHRWGRRQDARTHRDEPIVHATVAGRTTAWVPSRQR